MSARLWTLDIRRKYVVSIQEVIKTPFSDGENKVDMDLVQELYRETTAPTIKSLFVELDKRVIGYVSYTQIF